MDLILAQYILRYSSDAQMLNNNAIVAVNNAPGIVLLAVTATHGDHPTFDAATRTLLLLSCAVGYAISVSTPAVQRTVTALSFSMLGILSKAVVACIGVLI